MTSELRRIAQGLIECLEDVTRIAGQVHHTAARLRDDAAYVVAVSPADPESRALALKLDASARACETGVHHANTALPKAIAWVESKIRESELTTEPASPGHERTPSPLAATKNPGRSTDDVLRSFGTLPGGQQKSVRTVSSEAELRQIFDAWVAGAERLPPRGPKVPEVHRLSDGGELQWRTTSASGGAAIDIIPGNGPRRKVHIK